MKKVNAYVDFDRTIHAYTSKFTHETEISDGPYIDENGISGIDFIRNLFQADFNVTIFSTRGSHEGFALACIDWFRKFGLEEQFIFHLKFTNVKGDLDFIFDDRGINMHGTYPSVDSLKKFKPYDRRNADNKTGRQKTFDILYRMKKITGGLFNPNDYEVLSKMIDEILEIMNTEAV